MAMIMRLLIGWALTYGLSVLLAVGYDMLTDVDVFFWPMLVFLVTFNLIAFVASAVGVLKLKKPKYIAIGYIVVTLGLFAARIFKVELMKIAFLTTTDPRIVWCICNLITYVGTMFCLVRLGARTAPVED